MGSVQVCAVCGDRLSELDPRTRCDCGGLLEIRHDPPVEDGTSLRRLFEERWGQRDDLNLSGVWRYRELVMPTVGDRAVTHPEGNTPLIRRPRIAEWAALPHLVLKHEGHNPTGSFKDRGMTVGVTQATNALALATCCDVPNSQAVDYSTAQQLITTAWNQLVAIVLVLVVFGWTGGKQLVGQSYTDAKVKVAETKEERKQKKAAKKEAKAQAKLAEKSDDA